MRGTFMARSEQKIKGEREEVKKTAAKGFIMIDLPSANYEILGTEKNRAESKCSMGGMWLKPFVIRPCGSSRFRNQRAFLCLPSSPALIANNPCKPWGSGRDIAGLPS